MKFFGLDVFNKLGPLKNALRASSRNTHHYLDEFERLGQAERLALPVIPDRRRANER